MRIPFIGPVAVFGLLQIVLWFVCFMVVGVVMKAYGYPGQLLIGQFHPFGLFFRHWGLVFVLIPMIWTLWASWDWDASQTPVLEEKDHLATGTVLLGLTIFLVVVFITSSQPRMKTVIMATDI